jgi:hypothetical protein
MTIVRHKDLTRVEMADKLRSCRRWDNVEYRINNNGQRTLSICRPSSRNHYYTETIR